MLTAAAPGREIRASIWQPCPDKTRQTDSTTTGFTALVDERRRSAASGVEFPREENRGPAESVQVVLKKPDLGHESLLTSTLFDDDHVALCADEVPDGP